MVIQNMLPGFNAERTRYWLCGIGCAAAAMEIDWAIRLPGRGATLLSNWRHRPATRQRYT
jgi:hypothetical protein